MVLIHEKSARGRTKMGWLDSHHTFSFGGFHDPSRMGHRALRVLNEDVVIPGAGFGEHDHEEMDIISYVISGGLGHGDSIGNSSIIKAGDFQHMYAGTGARRSEMNASDTEPAHSLQIWIIPGGTDGSPTYFQTGVDLDAQRNAFIAVAGPDEHASRAMLRSDTWVYMAGVDDERSVHHEFTPGRASFLQVV